VRTRPLVLLAAGMAAVMAAPTAAAAEPAADAPAVIENTFEQGTPGGAYLLGDFAAQGWHSTWDHGLADRSTVDPDQSHRGAVSLRASPRDSN
jgi:opacity protein-like surface antigen